MIAEKKQESVTGMGEKTSNTPKGIKFSITPGVFAWYLSNMQIFANELITSCIKLA